MGWNERHDGIILLLSAVKLAKVPLFVLVIFDLAKLNCERLSYEGRQIWYVEKLQKNISKVQCDWKFR